MEIENKLPMCQTEGCGNIAIGVLNGKFRCGECIVRYDQKLKKMREKYFKDNEVLFTKQK